MEEKVSHCERMLKNINTTVFKIGLLITRRAKFLKVFFFLFLFFLIRPCRNSESIYMKDQVEDLL